MEAGILEPGEGVVTHFYHGNTDVADLSARGELLWEGRVFESPSAFSIAVKRRVNPGRKADDGWKSVKVRGRLLEEYKKTYLLTVVAPSIKAGLRVPGTQGGAAQKASAAAQGKAKAGAGAGAGSAGAGGRGAPAPLPARRAPLSQEALDFAERAAEIARKETERPAKRARAEAQAQGAAAPPSGGGGGGGAAAPPGPLAAPRTEYAQRRPRRQVPRPQEWSPGMDGADEHCVVRAEAFSGEPGDEQPFRCGAFAAALLVMDFHAHLSSEAEVIGLLGGTWDPARRELQVQAAFPVRELPPDQAAADEGGAQADGGADVEMDPEGEVEARETIRRMGLVCVGWYLSHPRVQPQPSILNTRTQLNYQKVYEEPASGLQPFVGAIVSPFDAEGAPGGGAASQIGYFYVQCTDAGLAARLPIGGNPLEYGHVAKEVAVEFSSAGDLAGVLESVKVLSERYCGLDTRTDFDEPWNPAGAGAGGGEPLPALEKMMVSLGERLPATWGKASRLGFLRGIKGIVSSAWMRGNAQARQALVEKNQPMVMIKMRST